jgi:hypothetical protein
MIESFVGIALREIFTDSPAYFSRAAWRFRAYQWITTDSPDRPGA